MAHCTPAAAIVLVICTASCASSNSPGGYGMSGSTAGATTYTTFAAAPMDPNRKVAEQDCSKPVELDRGNLRCK